MKLNYCVNVGASNDKDDGDEEISRIRFKQNSNNNIDIDIDIDDDDSTTALPPPKASLFKVLLKAGTDKGLFDGSQWFLLCFSLRNYCPRSCRVSSSRCR